MDIYSTYPEMQLSPGVRIRSFEVLAPLGAGGMGAVYRARDIKLGRDVAIKILQEKLSDSREHLVRFQREARAASALNHPNIITIFEIDEYEGAPFIAMELIDGMSLRELLSRGPLPIRKLLDVAVQIAEGLAAAHEHSIVHRDLKPDNVMLTVDGRIKIVDFGLARVEPSASADVSTASITNPRTPQGRVLGTAAYVSPEQAAGNTVDFRSDQFSFGAVIYELATGRKAFQRSTTMETLAAIMRDEPEPMQNVNPRVPAQLCWIVERCLAKDPADRYASTRDLAHELRTLRERLPQTSPGNRLRVAMRRSWTRIAAAVATVALVAGGAFVYRTNFKERITPALPPIRVVGVLPFKDLTGRPDGQLYSDGFAEAVRARLKDFRGLQVARIDENASRAIHSGADVHRVAQEIGATLLIRASVQRSAEQVRVVYSLIDAANGNEIATHTIDGSAERLLALQDEVAQQIARDLGARDSRPALRAGLETKEEQETYVRALGALEHADDPKSIDSAITLLHEVLESAPSVALVHAALGRAYFLKYRHTFDRQWSEKAVRACNRARSLDPDLPDTLVTLATIQSHQGQYDDAIRTYQRALAVQPASAVAAIGLGSVFQANRQYAEAEQAFRRGIALNPTWWFGHNELGSMYLFTGRYDDGLAEYREVIRLAPHVSWGYTNAGAVLFSKGRLAEAAEMFERATTIQADPVAWLNLGSCYFFLGQYDKAIECDRAAIQLVSGVSTYWVELGDASAWSAAHRTEALAVYAKARDVARDELAINPKSSRALAAIAIAAARTGDFATARASIRRAIELQPQNPERLYQAARVANLAGDSDEAISLLKRALASGSFVIELERHPEFARLREKQAVRDLLNTRKPG